MQIEVNPQEHKADFGSLGFNRNLIENFRKHIVIYLLGKRYSFTDFKFYLTLERTKVDRLSLLFRLAFTIWGSIVTYFLVLVLKKATLTEAVQMSFNSKMG